MGIILPSSLLYWSLILTYSNFSTINVTANVLRSIIPTFQLLSPLMKSLPCWYLPLPVYWNSFRKLYKWPTLCHRKRIMFYFHLVWHLSRLTMLPFWKNLRPDLGSVRCPSFPTVWLHSSASLAGLAPMPPGQSTIFLNGLINPGV